MKSVTIWAVSYTHLDVYKRQIQKRLKEYRQYLNEKRIDFLIHINHELRTPLTLIYAPLKRLMDKSEMQGLPQHLIPQLQLLFNQAQHMREIVDMVLDWSSLEADLSLIHIYSAGITIQTVTSPQLSIIEERK